MKKILVFSILLCCMLAACNNQSANTKAAAPKTDTSTYYPVSAFFRDQVQYVDLRNFPIKQLHTVNGKKDSAVISKDQFLAWGTLFTQQATLFTKNKILYKETVFKDQSTQSVTLTYTPFERLANGIQSMDVLLDETTNQPKRIFIKTTHVSGDTATTEQYNWRSYKGFQFTRFITAHNFSSVELAEVNWQAAKTE